MPAHGNLGSLNIQVSPNEGRPAVGVRVRIKGRQVRAQMQHRGVTVTQAAAFLGFNKGHASRLLDGSRPWPEDKYGLWERFCVELLNVAPDAVAELERPCACCGFLRPRGRDRQRVNGAAA